MLWQVKNGGTGAPTAAGARINLGLEIGEDIQAHHDSLDSLSTDLEGILTFLGLEQWYPEYFGASAPGVAATNTTAFLALEDEYPGREIDLRGRQYNVTSIPTGARYKNGTLTPSSGLARQYPLNVPDSPWHGWAQRHDSRICPSQLVVGAARRNTFDSGTDIGEEQLFLFEMGNGQHGTALQGKSTLLASVSENEGLEMRSYRTIVSDGSLSVAGGIRISNLTGDRIGGLVPMYDAGTTNYILHTWYTDDYLATAGTLTDVSGSVTDGHFCFQPAIPYPASDGGHDTDGWMWLTYKTGAAADENIYAIVTTDNLTTVSEILVKSGTGIIPSPAVAREGQLIRTPSGIFLFARPGVASVQSTVNVALADDLAGLATADWVSTGIRLDNNVCCAYYDRGNVVLLVVDRELASWDRNENMIRVYIQDHKSLWAAGGVFKQGAEHLMPMANRGTGEPQIYPLPEGEYLAVLRTGEANLSNIQPGGGHAILMRSQNFPALANPESVSVADPQEFVFNGHFQKWNGAKTFTAPATLTHLADNWESISNGDTINYSRVEVDNQIRDLTIHHPEYGMRMEVTASNGSTGFRNVIRGHEAKKLIKSLSYRPHISIGVMAYGDFPPAFVCGLTLDFGSGGSTDIVTANQTFPKVLVANDGMWYSEVHFSLDDRLAGTETFSADCSVILNFQNTTTATYDTTFIGVSGVIGKHPIWKPIVAHPLDYIGREDTLTLVDGDNNHNVYINNHINYVSGPTAAFGITGFNAPSHIREFFIYNDLGFDMKLLNESASSTAANRIVTGTGADDNTTTVGVYHMVYSRQKSRWVCVGKVG